MRLHFVFAIIPTSLLHHSLKIAEDLCAKDQIEEALPFLSKALKDPRNLDAWIEWAFIHPTRDDVIRVLTAAEKQGKYSEYPSHAVAMM